jgi:hypothetical protein
MMTTDRIRCSTALAVLGVAAVAAVTSPASVFQAGRVKDGPGFVR